MNEDALFEALEENRIAGAALDVFVGEPFDNLIVLAFWITFCWRRMQWV